MSSLFSEKKAAEAAAFLLLRAKARHANVTLLKLMKLLYLAERLSYERHGIPIIGDRMVSMDHGPVLSRTLDLIMHSELPGKLGASDSLIAEKSGRDMAIRDHRSLTVDDLLELSDSDVEVLDSIWRDFGGMSATI